MKLLIEIPEEAKQAFDCAESNDLKGCYYDHGGIIGNAIKNGKPLDNVLDEIWAEIEPKCDRINSLASVLPYTAHREIQELMCEIMDLCKAEGGGEDKE